MRYYKKKLFIQSHVEAIFDLEMVVIVNLRQFSDALNKHMCVRSIRSRTPRLQSTFNTFNCSKLKEIYSKIIGIENDETKYHAYKNS